MLCTLLLFLPLLLLVPLFQGRLFSYVDTHRHRLGPNYHQIPVNCPFAARPAHYLRDGPMTIDDNQGVGKVVVFRFSSSTFTLILTAPQMFIAITLNSPFSLALPPPFSLSLLLSLSLSLSHTPSLSSSLSLSLPPSLSLSLPGQAPNYFPNSFSGPADSPSCSLSKTTVVIVMNVM